MAATGALLGSAAISAAASTTNSLLSAGASALANYKQYKYSKKLMKYQYNLERKSRQTSYGDTKQSLLSAGYNPILGITGGQAQPLSPSATASSANSPNIDLGIADAVSAMQAISQNERLKNQNKNDDISVQNDTARAENESLESMQRQALTKAQVESQLLQNEITSATGMSKALNEVRLLEDEHVINQKQANYIEKQIGLATTQSALNIAHTANVNSATTALNYENEEGEAWSRFTKNHPRWTNVIRGMNRAGFTGRDIANTVGAYAGIKAIGSGKGNSKGKKRKE